MIGPLIMTLDHFYVKSWRSSLTQFFSLMSSMRFSQDINPHFWPKLNPASKIVGFMCFYNNPEFSKSVGFGQKCQNHPYIDQNRRFARFEMFSFQMHLKTHQMVSFWLLGSISIKNDRFLFFNSMASSSRRILNPSPPIFKIEVVAEKSELGSSTRY